MAALRYYVAATVDGFIAREDGAFDVFAAEGGHVADYVAFMRAQRVVLMGRRTYEVGLALGVTNPYPWLRQVVFSRTLPASPDANVELVAGDPAEFVRRLKAEQPDADLWLCGGGALAAALLGAGLVDEVIVKVSPVLLGSGVPLVARLGRAVPLDLVASTTHAGGVVVLRYGVRPDADVPNASPDGSPDAAAGGGR